MVSELSVWLTLPNAQVLTSHWLSKNVSNPRLVLFFMLILRHNI